MVDRIFTPNKGEINGRIRSEKSGEGSYPENKSGQPKKTIIIESKKVFAASIKDFTTREGILAYLDSLKMVNTSKKNKHTGDELRKIAEQVFAGGSIYKVKSVPLREQLKIILKLEKEGTGSSAAVAEELFDAVDAALDKQEAEQLSAGGTEAASLEVESASAEKLSAPSSSVEVKPPVEAEADSLEPGELEVVPSEEGEENRPEATEPEKDPKPKKPEEGPEEKERKTRERQERLAYLKTEIDQARKEYVEMDYKKNKAYKRLGRFFGNFFKNPIEATREVDPDVAYWKAHYEKELFEYKNLLLEDAKENGLTGRVLGEFLKEIAVDGNGELADVSDQVKLEHHEGKLSGFIKSHSMELVQGYKKLPLYQKLAIGAAFGLGASVAVGSVGAAASIAGSAVFARRLFMGLVTGTSVSIGLETRAQKRRGREAEEQEKEVAAKLEGKSKEEIYALLKEHISASNLKEDKKLHKIKNKNIRNMAIGIGVGATTTSLAYIINPESAPEPLKEMFRGVRGGINRVFEYFNNPAGVTIEGTGAADITDNNPEYPGYQDDLKSSLSETKIPAGVGADAGAPASSDAGAWRAASVPGAEHVEAPVGHVAENPVADTGENAVLKVEGGSSREGAITEYLNKHPDAVEKYNELHGGRGFDSGDIAHRMAVDYANENGIPLEKLDDVLPGQELELSSDGTKIVSMPDIDSADHLLDEEIVDAPELEAETASPGQPELNHVDNFPEDSSGSDHPGNFPPEDPHGYGLRHEEGLPEASQETAGAHSEVPAEKMESVVAAPKEVMIEEFKLDDATSVKISGLNSQINDLNAEIGEIDKQIDHIKIGANPTGDLPGRPGMTVDELVAEKERLTEDAFYLAKERNATYGLSVMRYVSEDKPNIWREIKNLPANQLLEDKKGLVYKFYAKISRYNVENFKGNIKPELGETLEKWIPRVVKMRTR